MLHARDAEAAAAGGADRLLLGHEPDGRVLLARARGGLGRGARDRPAGVRGAADPRADSYRRLVDLGATFLELGARGLAFGFLDRDLEIDREACAEMCAELGGVPWLFHGFDEALDVDRAWRDVSGCPAWSR